MLAAVLVLSSALTGCTKDTVADSGYEESDSSAESVSQGLETSDTDDSKDNTYEESEDNDQSLATEAFSDVESIQVFIGEQFSDKKVNNEDDALDVIYDALEYIGGDNSTELEFAVKDGPTSEGNTFYTFRQVSGDIAVFGASVKLVADKGGNPIGLNSTLISGLKENPDINWSLDAAEAEAIVKETLKKDGVSVNIIPNATEQTLLPLEDGDYVYVWVVYTKNFYDDVDTAYLAHYVDWEGEYLYPNPVTSPGNVDALSGAGATFAFEGLEADTWTGTVKKYHGEKEKVTIPVAKDPETGDIYLADVDRKVMCADYSEFWNEDDLSPRIAKNGKFDDNEVLIYKGFLEVYDYFESIGWVGPDGEGSPSLLLLDWVDDDGEPVHNACYAGKMIGFDVFQFNRDEPDGESYDTMAHEYTHAVTTAAMLANIYMNDYGAINEAMSDIFGNLIESLMGKTKDKTWLIQENGIEPIRCMSDPHQFEQPAFVWDEYYVPGVSEASDYNDNGGVHRNSSLLNLIAYRLNESGMAQEDQLYFWQNVSLILTPRTDYPQIADILPWVMKLIGEDSYVDVLEKAIDETGIRDKSLPETPPDKLARFQMVFPDEEILEQYNVFASAENVDTGQKFSTWAEDETDLMAITVDPGYYIFYIQIFDEDGEEIDLIKSREGWTVETTDDELVDSIIFIDEGEIYEFDSSELNRYLSGESGSSGDYQ